jgi:3-oxoadipate enol-lactonase
MVVEVHGEGAPVLMVHGLGGSSNVFGAQVGALTRFFRCIRPDLPGSGRTRAVAPFSIDDLVDRLLGLLDGQGVSAVHLVGHSMGTILCQHLAVRRPELVRSLALIAPLTEPAPQGRTGLRERAARARKDGMAVVADAVSAAALSAHTKAAKPELVALFRDALMSQDREGYALTCEALADATAANADAIACPVLLIAGEDDLTAPLLSVFALAQRLPDSRVVVVARAAHLPLLEQPAPVTTALLEFLLGQS